MKTVFFDMVGCRLNQAEIEDFARDFSSRGYTVVEQAVKADLIVVNTCCVTLKAAADSRKMLRHYQALSSARVIGTGCWNSAFPEQADSILDVTDQVSNPNKVQLIDLMGNIDSPVIQSSRISLGARQRTRSFVKVQDGCSNRCSYCLTQIARGPSRSEPIDKIINTINLLVENGTNEVVLTGVQIGSWGKELGERHLHDLIDTILEQTAIQRLRLSSIEPWDVTETLLKRFDNPRFCPHMHIPIQSGSDRILAKMRRPTDKRLLSEILGLIREKHSAIALTTDIIVGFPGESEEDFQKTLEFIEFNRFSGGHVFKFSPMPGTDALFLPDQIQESIKKGRLNQVQALFDRLSFQAMAEKVGSMQEVLFEASRNGFCEGFTPDYFRVKTKADGSLTNTLRIVELTAVLPEGKLEGRLA